MNSNKKPQQNAQGWDKKDKMTNPNDRRPGMGTPSTGTQKPQHTTQTDKQRGGMGMGTTTDKQKQGGKPGSNNQFGGNKFGGK